MFAAVSGTLFNLSARIGALGGQAVAGRGEAREQLSEEHAGLKRKINGGCG